MEIQPASPQASRPELKASETPPHAKPSSPETTEASETVVFAQSVQDIATVTMANLDATPAVTVLIAPKS
jgi:hypothetical protein